MIPASWRIYPGDGMRAIGSYSPGFDAAAYPFFCHVECCSALERLYLLCCPRTVPRCLTTEATTVASRHIFIRGPVE